MGNTFTLYETAADAEKEYAKIKVKKRIVAKILAISGGLFALLFIPLLLITVIIGVTPGPMTGYKSGAPSAFALEEIPPYLMPIYMQAQDKYNVSWSVLASINYIETRFGTDLSVSSAGAMGFMQFMPGTWEAYKQDGNNDGIYDPDDPWDAIFSAANYLNANNFAENPEQAIWHYNHADWYVKQVLERAQAYSSTQLPATPIDSETFWPLPIQYTYISSAYGMRMHPTKKVYKLHDGIDLPAEQGTPIYAVQGGQVVWSQYKGDYGLTVTIDHGTHQTMYCHMSNVASHIKNGITVEGGEQIGYVGSTGASTGPHLHFTLYVNGQTANPEEWLTIPSGNY